MIVTSAVYNQFGLIIAVIDGVEMTVPNDLNNSERQAIAAWEAEGNQIQPYVAPPPPPTTILAGTFFGRMTDAEYDALDESIQDGETRRVYREWSSPVASYTEGTTLWDLIVKHLDLTAGEPRRKEIMAPAENAAMAFDDAPSSE